MKFPFLILLEQQFKVFVVINTSVLVGLLIFACLKTYFQQAFFIIPYNTFLDVLLIPTKTINQ